MNQAAATIHDVGEMGDFDPNKDQENGTVSDPLSPPDGMGEQEQDGDHKESRVERLKQANVNDIATACAEGIEKIRSLELERSTINSKIKAIRDDLESKGINRNALAVNLAISKMDDDKLDGFDLSNQILRNAINKKLEYQPDLF